jgi:hypothetical protein
VVGAPAALFTDAPPRRSHGIDHALQFLQCFARDLLVSEVILGQFRDLNVRVVAADSGTDLTAADEDPTRVLIRQMLGAVSQFEKSVIVAKLRAARTCRRRATGRCEGRKRFGEPPGEEPVLHRIRQLRRKPRGRERRSPISSTRSGCRRGWVRPGGREGYGGSCGGRPCRRDHLARAAIEPQCPKCRRWWWR